MNTNNILLVLLLASQVQAEDFNYFEKRIDYFSAGQNKTAVRSKKTENPDTTLFDWQKYMNPSNTEFFKEGEHTPPEPFMEVARNPTDQNLRMWFSYIDKKNQIANRFQLRMAEYMKENAMNTNVPTFLDVKPQVQQVTSHVDVSRFKFRFFFDSSCPHCKKMFQTMKDLNSQGFRIEGRQTDDIPISAESVGFDIEKAQKQELLKHQIQGVPFLLIADRQSKAVMKVAGFQSTQEVLQKLNKFKQ